MRVGFIGLGRMGAPMAARIAAAGHGVVGYDSSAERRQLAGPGVVLVDSPAAVALDADVVITSLPGPAEVENVVHGRNGVLASLKPAAVLVETSTISPQQSRTLAHDLAIRKASYLDAPVSGGAQGARDGTLVAMVGGAAEALDTARPVLACFAKHIFHLGPVGAGNVMKLVIQSIFLSQMAGFLEAVSMGERSGIALDTLLRIVAVSSAHHPAIGTRYEKNPVGQSRSDIRGRIGGEGFVVGEGDLARARPTVPDPHVRAVRLQRHRRPRPVPRRPHRGPKLA